MRKEPYFQVRVRESLRGPLQKSKEQEGRLGSLNLYIEEVLFKHVRDTMKKKRPSGGS